VGGVQHAGRGSQARDQHRHAVFEHHVDLPLHFRGVLDDGVAALALDLPEQDVDAEGPVGEGAHGGDLGREFVGRQALGADHAEPARSGYRTGERAAGDEAHAGLADRVGDAEAFGQRGRERVWHGAAGAWGGAASITGVQAGVRRPGRVAVTPCRC
jgi:hypothetical protein